MHFKEYKTILSPQNGMNVYRGCTHGCIYCDSRSKCYQMDHDFTDIEVKKDAAKKLDYELSRKRQPVMIGTGSMSDPYNHYEEKLEITRECLKVILKHRCGVAIQTKSARILRDMDLLDQINKTSKAVVQVTLTAAEDSLSKIIEPDVSLTSERLEILKRCKELGISTVVWLCPFLPYLNDTKANLMALLDMCSQYQVYGILFFGVGLTLREGNREYFYQKLDESFPRLKEQYQRVYGDSYEVSSRNNKALSLLLEEECKKRGILFGNDKVFEYLHTYTNHLKQMSLFEEDL